MANKKPTTYDIAKLSGVSQSTVSMILNNNQSSRFSEKTINRVLSTAAELGYEIPSRKNQKRTQSGNIAILTPSLTNPYYCELIYAIESEVLRTGYTASIFNIRKDAKTELKQIEMLQRIGVDGILFLYVPLNEQVVKELAANMPVVMVSDKTEGIGIDAVEMSGFKSGMMIAEHLMVLGHKKAAFISSSFKTAIIRKYRFRAISQAFCEQAGREVFLYTPDNRDTSLSPGFFTEGYDIGYSFTQMVLREHPEVTALIGGNDQQAYGILDALHDLKARVPQDFSVCGFDDNHPSRYRNISLTTVDPFIGYKGKEAYSILARKISAFYEQQPVLTVKIEYSPGLLVRSSTGPCRSAAHANIVVPPAEDATNPSPPKQVKTSG